MSSVVSYNNEKMTLKKFSKKYGAATIRGPVYIFLGNSSISSNSKNISYVSVCIGDEVFNGKVKTYLVTYKAETDSYGNYQPLDNKWWNPDSIKDISNGFVDVIKEEVSVRKIIEAVEVNEAEKAVLTEDSTVEGKKVKDWIKKYGSGVFKGETYAYITEPDEDVSVEDRKYQWDYLEVVAVKLGEEIRNGKVAKYIVLYEKGNSKKPEYVQSYAQTAVKK